MATCIFLLTGSDLFAQRITYESLRARDRQPNVFIEHVVIPDAMASEMSLVTLFRIENNFLSFRRYRGEGSDDPARRFYAEPSVRLTIRKTNDSSEPETGRNSLITRSWNETIYSETYEQTQSSTSFLQGKLETPLDAGRYHIESTVSANRRTRRDVSRRFQIPDTSDTDVAFLYFLDDPSEISLSDGPPGSALMNMGKNVYFGRDHQLVIWFPGININAGYTLQIHQMRIQRGDTTATKQVMEYQLDNDNMRGGYRPEITMSDDRPFFQWHETGNSDCCGFFYLLSIPNSRFENAPYRIQLLKATGDDRKKVVAERAYESLWLDMPVSLLSLDVAIDMMRFMVDSDTHRSLRRGNRQERERRFREFWSERDPTPDREYNELMVEYYRRIDYAYDNFSSPDTPGYESDQGKIYIRLGEPDRRERIFPPNQPARETWYYSDRTFVFEATTGFGDYKLIERR